MPDKKMGKKQKDTLKKLLMEIKENILHDIRNMTAGNGDGGDQHDDLPQGHGLHMADFATDMYDREFALGLASNDRELLQKVETALKKMEDDSYGLCSHCHQPIPSVRLEAIPYVETCLGCQEKIEQGS